jgi:hypothetical protein
VSKRRLVFNIIAYDDDGRKVKSHTATLKPWIWSRTYQAFYNGKPSGKKPYCTVTEFIKMIGPWVGRMAKDYLN